MKAHSTADLLMHPWILSADQEAQRIGNSKKKGNKEVVPNAVKVTLKELLNVSSDWKDVNKKNANGIPSFGGGVPIDF